MPGHLSIGAQVMLGSWKSEKSWPKYHLQICCQVAYDSTLLRPYVRHHRDDFSFPLMNQSLPLKSIGHYHLLLPVYTFIQSFLPLRGLSYYFSCPKSILLTHALTQQDHSFVQSGALCRVQGGEVLGCYLTQIISYVSHLRMLGSIIHSIFSKVLLCSGARAHNYHKTG